MILNIILMLFFAYVSWNTARAAREMLNKPTLFQKVIGGLLYGAISLVTGFTAILYLRDALL